MPKNESAKEWVDLEPRCCVCGQPLDEENVSQCNFCGGKFHLAWSIQATVPSCGHYWVDPQFCALVFACAHCGKKVPSPQS